MAESALYAKAEELLDLVCTCLAETDLTGCECFGEDLCCNRVVSWQQATVPDCPGAFVVIGGTDVDVLAYTASGAPCVTRESGLFVIGVAICPVDNATTSNKRMAGVVGDVSLHALCLSAIGESLRVCLESCCGTDNVVQSVSGLQTDESAVAVQVSARL